MRHLANGMANVAKVVAEVLVWWSTGVIRAVVVVTGSRDACDTGVV